MALALRFFCLFAALSLALGDTYLHNPRGSNNRLNERSANRNNANRLFNSQNNNRGGYNAGDIDTGTFGNEQQIYYMKYWQSGPERTTTLTLEWTNQHGCGGNEDNDPHKLNCNIVLQYMVMDYDPVEDAAVNNNNKQTRIRDGTNTGTQNFQQPNENTRQNEYNTQRNGVQANLGLHESYDYYADCAVRQRNQYLFTADQRLRGDTARFTRQNPNGNRNGYECPEERDYYPYWHPTPWRDIAVLTDNISLCDFYENESFNVKPRGICRRQNFQGGNSNNRPFSQYNNQEDCENADDNPGKWFTEYAYIDIEDVTEAECRSGTETDGLERVWAPPKYGEDSTCLVLPPKPKCTQAGWTRVNHLGNGRDGVPLRFDWTIPYFPSGRRKLAVVRVRYNISTDDYDPWNTNSSHNDNPILGVRSPVTQNPNINIGSTTNKPLQLAINTAQFGRTFQDRSHIMELRPRSLLGNDAAEDCDILNLNVRGKRGNIVQVYPSVEYDFIPNRLQITTAQCLHVQWTGSNSHNNGNPAGDGQAGDQGEGTTGTDRSNIVQTLGPDVNYPIPWEKNENNMFENVEVLWTSTGVDPDSISPEDTAVTFASAGYYHCMRSNMCPESVEAKQPMNQLLNNAPASFEGALLRFKAKGTYHYICSRNNNFTNRSQKGQIVVTETATK